MRIHTQFKLIGLLVAMAALSAAAQDECTVSNYGTEAEWTQLEPQAAQYDAALRKAMPGWVFQQQSATDQAESRPRSAISGTRLGQSYTSHLAVTDICGRTREQRWQLDWLAAPAGSPLAKQWQKDQQTIGRTERIQQLNGQSYQALQAGRMGEVDRINAEIEAMGAAETPAASNPLDFAADEQTRKVLLAQAVAITLLPKGSGQHDSCQVLAAPRGASAALLAEQDAGQATATIALGTQVADAACSYKPATEFLTRLGSAPSALTLHVQGQKAVVMSLVKSLDARSFDLPAAPFKLAGNATGASDSASAATGGLMDKLPGRGLFGSKAGRQQDRVEGAVENKVDETTDKVVDGVVNKALDSLFGR